MLRKQGRVRRNVWVVVLFILQMTVKEMQYLMYRYSFKPNLTKFLVRVWRVWWLSEVCYWSWKTNVPVERELVSNVTRTTVHQFPLTLSHPLLWNFVIVKLLLLRKRNTLTLDMTYRAENVCQFPKWLCIESFFHKYLTM